MTFLKKTKNIVSYLTFSLAISLLFFACKNDPALIKFNGKALGTFYSISYYDSKARNLQPELDSLFARFNHSLSVYDSTSVISQINRNVSDSTDEWFRYVFEIAKEVYKNTDEFFDPTVAPLVNVWGFGFSNAEEVTPEIVDSIISFVGLDKVSLEDNKLIKLDNRIMLDFNAIAKGYCVDIAAAFLESNHIDNYLVEIGGEIASKGKKDDGSLWKIGIEKPALNALDDQSVTQIIKISDKSLATSGNYRRYIEKDGKRYAHTINPKTGYPSENNLLSVTVVAQNCVIADAYATAFMAMGLENAKHYVESDESLEAFFIISDENNQIKTLYSKGFEKYIEK